MALRFYLNQEAFAQAVDQVGQDRTFIPDRDVVNINGITVKVDPDMRPYYEVRNERVPLSLLIPLPLKDMVEHCSWLMPLWPNCPTQEPGIYSEESAEATIENQDSGLKSMLHVYGPKIEEVYGLMRAIRAGRAKLVESWAWESIDEDNPALIAPPREEMLARIAEATGNPDVANMSDEEANAYMELFSSGVESEADAAVAAYTANPNRPTARNVVIQCQDCQAKFTIDANRTMGVKVNVLCRQCGGNIPVTDGKVVDKATRTGTPTPQDAESKDPLADPVHVLAWSPMIKFACPNCKAKYTLEPDKATGRTIRLKCRKCGQHMELKGREANDGGSHN